MTPNDRAPDIAFIIPIRNEEKFLDATLEGLLKQDLGPYTAEILLADGRSTDRSMEILKRWETSRSTPNLTFRALDNDKLTAPGGFNLGIRESRARIVGFGGAHTIYPPHHLRRAAELLNEVPEASVVGGGATSFTPSTPGALGVAMCCLYQSPLGAGVAPYHRRKTPGWVDTVFGGFYRREVFEKVGVFEERLTKNQDNELNTRVLEAGLKIYFHPDMSAAYVQKTDYESFIKRPFIMAGYHPSTWKLNPASFRARHAIPAAMVVYLASLGGLALLGQRPRWLAVPAALYGGLLMATGAKFALKESPLVGALVPPLFFAFHLSYGLGTLARLGDLLGEPGSA